MKKNMTEILCCPLCKRELKLKSQIITKSNEKIVEGSMVCSFCGKEYLIQSGIPRMYIPDDEIITLSNNKNFSKFIITPEKLDKYVNNRKVISKNVQFFFTNQILTKFLLGSGWVLLSFGIIIILLSYFSYFNFDSTIINSISLSVIYLFIGMSFIFLFIDYLRYRIGSKIEYTNNMHTLKNLLHKNTLSEYDIRISTADKEENFKDKFENQRDFVDYKGNKISSILDKYNFKLQKILNVGCGGALHKSASQPYFDKGYEMTGVDINEEYLKQFNQIFNADVVQANSLALPFRSNNFDLINFTDIVEHLHHPLLGLSEAQRVLKTGGVIVLTTNNHCAFSFRCMNPLIFVEKVVSIYYDRILPPRNILGSWMNFNFYHTEFSKNEITGLLNATGFKINSFETQFPNRSKLTMLFRKFPVLRFMGGEHIIIAEKKQEI